MEKDSQPLYSPTHCTGEHTSIDVWSFELTYSAVQLTLSFFNTQDLQLFEKYRLVFLKVLSGPTRGGPSRG